MRKISILLLFGLLSFVLYGQRNPHKEILVLFKNGIERENTLVDGKNVLNAKINSIKLMKRLEKIGIGDRQLVNRESEFPREGHIECAEWSSDQTSEHDTAFSVDRS